MQDIEIQPVRNYKHTITSSQEFHMPHSPSSQPCTPHAPFTDSRRVADSVSQLSGHPETPTRIEDDGWCEVSVLIGGFRIAPASTETFDAASMEAINLHTGWTMAWEQYQPFLVGLKPPTTKSDK